QPRHERRRLRRPGGRPGLAVVARVNIDRVLQIAIPIVSFGLMMLVGLSLTVDDLRSAVRNRRAFAAGVLLPWAFVPLPGWLTAALGPLPVGRRISILLLTACPTGGMANMHSLLARSNTALAVSLTAISCFAAWGTTPAVLWLYSRASLQISPVAV